MLHLFLQAGPALDAEAVVDAVKTARADGDQVVTVAMLGHKADIGVMALGPDLWRAAWPAVGAGGGRARGRPVPTSR